MNFKKLAFLGLLLASTAVPTLPVTRLITRLARPALQRLSTVGSTVKTGLNRQLPTPLSQPNKFSRLLAGAGVATATAALFNQQPAESAAERVVVSVYTTPKGFKKRIIIVQNSNPKISPEIQAIIDKHNAEMTLMATGLKKTTSPSYLLVEANEQTSRSLKEGQKPETLIESAIFGASTGNGSKPQTIFFDKQDSEDSYLLELVLSSDEELLQKHKISAEQRNAALEKELYKCAEKNNTWAEARINKANLPENPPVKAYVRSCVSDTYNDDASLPAVSYATAHTATVAHVLCEVFEKITMTKENNTIVVVANRFVAQELQKALDKTNNSKPGAVQALKVLAHLTPSEDGFVKEDFGAMVATWIQEHENKFDGKTQK